MNRRANVCDIDAIKAKTHRNCRNDERCGSIEYELEAFLIVRAKFRVPVGLEKHAGSNQNAESYRKRVARVG